MSKEPTQKAKMALRAIPYTLSTDVKDDFYLTTRIQKSLSMKDLAAEVAALSTRQEDAEDIARTGNALLRRMMWYLSSGYSISTEMGNFRVTVKGVLRKQELTDAPDRSRVTLAVSYAMSDAMRQALDDAELDIEIQQTTVGPQLFSVVSGHDADHPDAVTRGESVPVGAGELCVIKGKNIKVGGTGEDIGVTLRRVDDSSDETVFIPASRLSPNTGTRVGFVMPASAPDQSEWEVTLCTQLASDGKTLLKETRTSVMPDTFFIGQTSTPDTPGGDEEEDDNQSGSPL